MSDLEKLLASSLTADGTKAVTVGVAALADQYAEAGTKASAELDDFAAQMEKVLEAQSEAAGAEAATALAKPFSTAGTEAGESFTKNFEEALTVKDDVIAWPEGAGAAGDTAGEDYSSGFKKWMSTDDAITWPSAGAFEAGAAAGKEYGSGFDSTAPEEEAAGGAAGAGATDLEAGAAGAGAAGAAGGDASKGLLATIMDPEVLAPIVATVGSLWAAINLQDYVNKIAGAEDISTKAATKIGSSWEDMGGKSEFSANEMADAFSQVAGQYQEVVGPGNDAAKATDLFKASADLATASGDDLAPSMQAIVSLMQAYKMPADEATKAATALYTVSEKSGQPIGTVTTQFQKLHSQLGNLTPPLGQLGGLFLDLLNNGESGRAGIGAVQTAIQTMLKPTTDLNVAQGNLKNAFNLTTGPSRTLANELAHGKLTSEQYTQAVEGLHGPQAQLANDFQSAYNKVTTATQAVKDQGVKVTDLKGNFVGIGSIIDQLNKKFQGETESQKLATAQAVFGTSANRKLIGVIEDGPAAFEKYTKQASATKDMQQAAAKNAETLSGKWKTMEGSAVDLGDKIGTALIPILSDVLTWGGKVIGWIDDFVGYLETHKKTAEAFGVALAIAFAPFIGIPALIGLVVAAAVVLVNNWKTVETFFTKLGKAVWTALDGAWNKVKTDAITTWDAINHFFSGIPDKIVGFFLKWNIVSVILDHWNAIEADAKAAWGAVMSIIKGPVEKIAVLLFNTWETIATDAYKVLAAVTTFIQKIPGEIVGFFQKWTLVELIDKAWTEVETGVTTAWSKTLSFIQGIPGKVLHVFDDFGTLLVDVGEQLLEGLLSGMTSGVGKVLGGIPGIGKSILGGFKSVLHVFSPSQDMIEIGQFMLAGLDQGMGDPSQKSSIMSTITTLGNSMLSSIKALVPDFTTVGQQLMEGLASGIESAASQVAAATAAAATASLAAAKTATKTASPSQAFAELGENLMAGLAQGVMSAASLARNAVSGVTGGLTGAATLTGHGAGGGGGVNVTGPLVVVQSPSGTLPASTL